MFTLDGENALTLCSCVQSINAFALENHTILAYLTVILVLLRSENIRRRVFRLCVRTYSLGLAA